MCVNEIFCNIKPSEVFSAQLFEFIIGTFFSIELQWQRTHKASVYWVITCGLMDDSVHFLTNELHVGQQPISQVCYLIIRINEQQGF